MAFPEKDYFTLQEIVDRWTRLKGEPIAVGYLHHQIVRGDLLTAVVDFPAGNYQDKHEELDEEGRRWTRTTTVSRFRLFSDEVRVPQIYYVHPEDARQIILNQVKNRKFPIHRLFLTRELNPKEGLEKFNNPLLVDVNDLVVTREERDQFEREHGISPADKRSDIPPSAIQAQEEEAPKELRAARAVYAEFWCDLPENMRKPDKKKDILPYLKERFGIIGGAANRIFTTSRPDNWKSGPDSPEKRPFKPRSQRAEKK